MITMSNFKESLEGTFANLGDLAKKGFDGLPKDVQEEVKKSTDKLLNLEKDVLRKKPKEGKKLKHAQQREVDYQTKKSNATNKIAELQAQANKAKDRLPSVTKEIADLEAARVSKTSADKKKLKELKADKLKLEQLITRCDNAINKYNKDIEDYEKHLKKHEQRKQEELARFKDKNQNVLQLDDASFKDFSENLQQILMYYYFFGQDPSKDPTLNRFITYKDIKSTDEPTANVNFLSSMLQSVVKPKPDEKTKIMAAVPKDNLLMSLVATFTRTPNPTIATYKDQSLPQLLNAFLSHDSTESSKTLAIKLRELSQNAKAMVQEKLYKKEINVLVRNLTISLKDIKDEINRYIKTLETNLNTLQGITFTESKLVKTKEKVVKSFKPLINKLYNLRSEFKSYRDNVKYDTLVKDMDHLKTDLPSSNLKIVKEACQLYRDYLNTLYTQLSNINQYPTDQLSKSIVLVLNSKNNILQTAIDYKTHLDNHTLDVSDLVQANHSNEQKINILNKIKSKIENLSPKLANVSTTLSSLAGYVNNLVTLEKDQTSTLASFTKALQDVSTVAKALQPILNIVAEATGVALHAAIEGA